MPSSPARTPWRFFFDHRASPIAKLFLLFAVVYVISPIDLVPDIALVIGWLDDLAVAAAAATSLVLAMRRYTRTDPPPQVPAAVVETSGVEVR